jgi:hypothetical protein
MELTTEQMNALFRMRDRLKAKAEKAKANVQEWELQLEAIELSVKAIGELQEQKSKRKSLLR